MQIRLPIAFLLLCSAAVLRVEAGGSGSLPGTIQAEDYDIGGEGVGYHDTTAGNAGGVYRADDVDLENDGEGDYHVGFTAAEEYLVFTVSAGGPFRCRVRYRVASAGSGPFVLRLAVDDVTEDAVIAQGTGGSTNWVDVLSPRAFHLAGGIHTARLTFQTGGINLDELEFVEELTPVPPYLDPSQPISNRVSDLVGRMTTAEKIGQTALVDRRFLVGSPNGDPAHMESDIETRLLGAILSGGGSYPTPNTVVAWGDMVDRFQAYAMRTRLGIPMLYGSDALHGHNNMLGATLFPHNIGLGASRDEDLVERIAQTAAVEIAAAGVRWTFAPAVSVPRTEWWGRTYEGFAETPDVVGALGAAAIRGYQGTNLAANNSVLACAKHFAGDGGTVWGTGNSGRIDQGNVVLDEATFRALHLAPYQAAISNGVRTIMASYNSWNGDKLHGHTNLLTTVLRGEFGFDGMLFSDWAGVDKVVVPDSFPYRGSIVACVNAGIDMTMVPDRYVQYIGWYGNAVSQGRISAARLDEAVSRILTVKFEAGLFDRPFTDRTLAPLVGSPAHREVAREAVRKSVVSLKNDGFLLPLSKQLTRVYVGGDHANNLGYQCGGWSIEWQGGSGPITTGTTILQAIQATVSSGTVVDVNNPAGADVGIVVVGEVPYAEGLGDSQALGLSGASISAIDAVRNAGVPVVVVLISGRPLIIDPHIDNWDACLAAWLPGTEGQGIADVLFGDYNPRAALSQTWPSATNTIPINVGDASYDPLFTYGFAAPLLPSLELGFGSPAFELRWPADAAGYAAQHAPLLQSAWTNLPGTPLVVGDDLVLTNELPAAETGFFRLSRP